MMRMLSIMAVLALAMFQPLEAGAGERDLIISLGEIPGQSERNADGELVGGYAELARLLARHYEAGVVTLIGPFPLAESLQKVVDGEADAHLPLIHIEEPGQSFAFASSHLLDVHFALYTNVDGPELDPADLEGRAIEIQQGQASLFGFTAIESESLPASLERLERGEIDGYIMEATATDAYIRDHGLTHVRKQPFRDVEGCVAIPLGERGREVDELLSPVIDHIKAMPEYAAITRELNGE